MGGKKKPPDGAAVKEGEKMNIPITIRCYITVEFEQSVPKGYVVGTDEGFGILVDGKEYSIDFCYSTGGFDDLDRKILTVEYRDPDRESFEEGFGALSLENLKKGNIKLTGNLDNVITAGNFDGNKFVKIARIKDARLVSPFNEFEDIVLI